MPDKSSGSSESPRRPVIRATRHGELFPASPNEAFRALAEPRHLGAARAPNSPLREGEMMLPLHEPINSGRQHLTKLACLLAVACVELVIDGLRALRYTWVIPDTVWNEYRWLVFSTRDRAQATVELSESTALGDKRTLHRIDLRTANVLTQEEARVILVRNTSRVGLYRLTVRHDAVRGEHIVEYTVCDPDASSTEFPRLK